MPDRKPTGAMAAAEVASIKKAEPAPYQRRGTLVEFFQNSPPRDSGIDLERSREVAEFENLFDEDESAEQKP